MFLDGEDSVELIFHNRRIFELTICLQLDPELMLANASTEGNIVFHKLGHALLSRKIMYKL
jgi:hypothetical protein